MKGSPHEEAPALSRVPGASEQLQTETLSVQATTADWALQYVRVGWALVDIPRGRKWPIHPGWNREQNAIRDEETATRLTGNVGLAHLWSGTCCLDVDDLEKAKAWLAGREIDLASLLAAPDAVQIVSGNPGHAKLLYRLPAGVEWLPTHQLKDVGLEFRCATQDGAGTVQDVLPPSIHPDTGKPYGWEGKGDWRNLAFLPENLHALWRTLGTGRGTHPDTPVPEDPVLAAIRKADLLLQESDATGKVCIRCPWQEEHTSTSGTTETVLWLPHYGGHDTYGFKCQHAHCTSRNFSDLRQWLVMGQFLPESDSNEAVFQCLARLSPVEYDRARQQEAVALGIRVVTLDAEVEKRRPRAEEDHLQGHKAEFPEPEPWAAPVDGAALLDELSQFFTRHAVLPDRAADTLAQWTVFTYQLDTAPVAPILSLVSPEKRCGKTRVISLLTQLVCRPLPASNVSPAVVFRVIEKHHPTLLIDEADTFLGYNADLRSVLNAGHTRAAAFVWRTVGDDHEPRQFSTWGAKAIACIGSLPNTLEDRSIVLPMRRKLNSDEVAEIDDDTEEECAILRRKIARWVADQRASMRDQYKPARQQLQFLNDRARDNWTPLLAIASLAGGAWPERARQAALALSGGEATDTGAVGVELLVDIRQLWPEGTDGLPSTDLVALLVQDPEKRWATYKRGEKPLDPRALATLLKPYGIRTKNRRHAGGVCKSYALVDFTDAFARYLPPKTPSSMDLPPFDPLQSNNSMNTRLPTGIGSATRGGLLRIENAPEPASNMDCYAVADKTPPLGREEGMGQGSTRPGKLGEDPPFCGEARQRGTTGSEAMSEEECAAAAAELEASKMLWEAGPDDGRQAICPPPGPIPEFAAFEERAAIMEFDGGMSREDAESAALALIRPLPATIEKTLKMAVTPLSEPPPGKAT